MDTALHIAAWVCLATGGFFAIVGGIGLLRLPDFYTRIHAGGVTDTLGAWLILGGLMLQSWVAPESFKSAIVATFKLAMILVLLALTSPTATHALAAAARIYGVEPQVVDDPEAPVS